MNAILRGVRVIDPLGRLDAAGQDVWIDSGKILAIYHHIDADSVPVVDLTPQPGAEPCVLSPGFIDLHVHARDPGDADAETVESAARAAAAGGFTHIVTMANTTPPIDTPERVSAARERAAACAVSVLQVAALTRGLEGADLVDIAGCIEAGAVALSDDGRNAASPRLLAIALTEAGRLSRPVLLHPEDEEAIAQINGAHGGVSRCPERPAATEARAVDLGIRALSHAGSGHLHLQHITCEASVDALRRARDRGASVSAEVTPHHLSMWLPSAEPPEPQALLKVNPPLRGEHDRTAMVKALRDGVIDAVATDHAPHRDAEKGGGYAEAAPGMIGLETALAMCLTIGQMGGAWTATLVERLTAGPHRVIGAAGGVPEPRLRIGEAATCTLFDPSAEWVVGAHPMQSRSRNTPLLGRTLHGRVLLTIAGGRVIHRDRTRVPDPAEVARA